MNNQGLNLITHASAFFMPFLVPVIIYLVASDELVKRTAVQAILFQVAMGILVGIATIFTILLIGLPFLVIFGVMWAVVPIIAIIKCLMGENYSYPIVNSFYPLYA